MAGHYYRIVVDFSHDYAPDDLTELFMTVADAIMDVLDPHADDESECERDLSIHGADVTHEYHALDRIDVDRFVHDLDTQSLMDKFIGRDET